ncbi:type II toxin-antitoxin system RelE/ParE family toxin [Streptomyces sp. NPDC057638]|uniref:type II toxin-antitoxin system RelE family toxin n=1 Tax=Streptomyces sp. NPDC057638 TaxID=3346190 RepID=UPI0036BE7D82
MRVWTTLIDGETVELPMTIAGVRARLPESEYAEFDAEMARTPGPRIAQILATWALPAVAWERIDPAVRRLKAGEYVGEPADERAVGPTGLARVRYTEQVRSTLDRMPAPERAEAETAIGALAHDPDGYGSARSGGQDDRRSVTVAGCVLVYYVSRADSVITVLHIVV